MLPQTQKCRELDGASKLGATKNEKVEQLCMYSCIYSHRAERRILCVDILTRIPDCGSVVCECRFATYLQRVKLSSGYSHDHMRHS